MTATTQEHTEELVKTYNQVIKQAMAAIETGWEQTAVAAKQFAAASQTELEEAGKTLEGAVKDAQSGTEKLADVFKDPAKFPPTGRAGFKQETKELVEQLIDGAKS